MSAKGQSIFQLTQHNTQEGLNLHYVMVIAGITLFMLTAINE